MTKKAILFVYGSTLLGVFVAWAFGGGMPATFVGVLAVAILVAAHKMKEEGEETFEGHSLLGGPIPWAEAPKQKRPPRLVYTTYQFVDAIMDRDSGIWRERWDTYSTKAFVFHFTNELFEGGGGEPAIVKAQLIWEYKNGIAGITFSPGAWIDEPCGTIEIPVGWAKKLIVGVRAGSPGGFYWDGYSNPRIHPHDTHRLDGQPVPIHGYLTIKLIGMTSEVWFEGKFEWTEDVHHNSHPGVKRLS